MDAIASAGSKRYWWAGVATDGELADLKMPSPMVCLLWDATGTWTRDQRARLIDRLLAADCRYAVCGGRLCEQWHDEIDELLAARAARFGDDGPLVMTTWHADEPIEEVAEFFVMHAHVLDEEIHDYVVVQVGLDWDIQCTLMDWVRRWVEHPYGEDRAPTG